MDKLSLNKRIDNLVKKFKKGGPGSGRKPGMVSPSLSIPKKLRVHLATTSATPDKKAKIANKLGAAWRDTMRRRNPGT